MKILFLYLYNISKFLREISIVYYDDFLRFSDIGNWLFSFDMLSSLCEYLPITVIDIIPTWKKKSDTFKYEVEYKNFSKKYVVQRNSKLKS